MKAIEYQYNTFNIIVTIKVADNLIEIIRKSCTILVAILEIISFHYSSLLLNVDYTKLGKSDDKYMDHFLDWDIDVIRR